MIGPRATPIGFDLLGPVAQLEERCPYKAEVEGSRPSRSTVRYSVVPYPAPRTHPMGSPGSGSKAQAVPSPSMAVFDSARRGLVLRRRQQPARCDGLLLDLQDEAVLRNSIQALRRSLPSARQFPMAWVVGEENEDLP